MELVDISRELGRAVGRLRFAPPVRHVYNPLDYAWEAHRRYLEKFARKGVPTVLVGMNPGPFGMVQTGVPFGEVELVRDWLGIEAQIRPPKKTHPKRPIEGFGCTRSEVSGRRLWGWARERYGTPKRFFRHFLVLNYCPLAFLEESGRNLTPDKLPASEKKRLFRLCDDALRASIESLGPRRIIGIGKFAEGRARVALAGLDLEIGTVLHPSPASPAANRGWQEQAERQLTAQGVALA